MGRMASSTFTFSFRTASGASVVAAAPLDAELPGDGDLDVIDVAPIPDGLEDPVREPEHHQVLDRLFPEVVIDPEDLLLLEHAGELAVERPRGVEVAAERLLDDDAPPAGVLAIEPCRAEPAHDDLELLGRGREVEERVPRRAVVPRDALGRRRDRRVGAGLLEVSPDVVEAPHELRPERVLDRARRELAHRRGRVLAEARVVERSPGDADEGEVRWQEPVRAQVVERRQKLALREVPQRAEDDEGAGVPGPQPRRVGGHLPPPSRSASAWPPNCRRIAERSFSPNVLAWRERKRA